MINLSSEREEHIKNMVLNDKALAKLCPVLEIGELACKTFFARNKDFFDTPKYLNSVPGHILTYCISRQLEQSKWDVDFPFKVNAEIINARSQYSIPILSKEDVSISILRCMTRKKLDTRDKDYLKQKCEPNNVLDGQLSYFENCLGEERTHGVLIYGVTKNLDEIRFADIVFFDKELKNEYLSINLLDKLKIYKSERSESDKEQNLLSAERIIKNKEETKEA